MFKENLKTKQKPTSSIQVVKKTFSLKCHFVAAMGQGESDVTASRNRVPGQETLMGGLPLAANGRRCARNKRRFISSKDCGPPSALQARAAGASSEGHPPPSSGLSWGLLTPSHCDPGHSSAHPGWAGSQGSAVTKAPGEWSYAHQPERGRTRPPLHLRLWDDTHML